MQESTDQTACVITSPSAELPDAEIPDAFTLIPCHSESDIARVFGGSILEATRTKMHERKGLRLLQALRLALEDSEQAAFENAKATLDSEIRAVPDLSAWGK